MLKLFSAPGSCALASHIALEEAGAEYELVRVDMARNEQREPAFLAINPKGRVPALLTAQGILTETPALLTYIAQRFPAARLVPLDDLHAFAQVQSFNSYLCSTVHVAHAHRPRASRWADDESAIAAMRRKVPQNMSACFELIEQEIFQGPWVMGDTYTVCDPYLFTMSQWLEADGVDITRFPRIRTHVQDMLSRPAVAKALALINAP